MAQANALHELRVVRPKRIYLQVAEQIEALIRSHALEAGARLPPERDLAELLGVSRPSIREALIALEIAGLIDVRIGDGTYVRRKPAAEAVFRPPRTDDPGPGLVEQFEARRAIECACASLAALAASATEIAELSASVDRMEQAIDRGEQPTEEHRRFHVMLAAASRNTILAGAVRELWRMRQGEMWSALRRHVENERSVRAGIALRRRLIDCLRRRDADGARSTLERHFARVGRQYFGVSDGARKAPPRRAAKARGERR